MKHENLIKLTSVILFLLISMASTGQISKTNYHVYFKKGTALPAENISDISNKTIIADNEQYDERYYRYIQFYKLPTPAIQKSLDQKGIKLLEYIPNNLYVASIPTTVNLNDLRALQVRSFTAIPANDKMDSRLEAETLPEWSIHKEQVRLILKYYSDINNNLVRAELNKLNIEIVAEMAHVDMFIIQLPPIQMQALANRAFVRYLDLESEPGKPESDDGRNLHRSNAIDVDYFGGYDFDGTGVSVAINDDGFAGPHIDFKGRADQSDVINDLSGTHGDMTVGIVGAAGNLDPRMRGMAPGAFLWVRAYSSSLPNTTALHQNNNVMVFSSSYSNGCNAGYTSTTQLVDEEIYDNPSLMQVFSAGNSNNNDCGYGAGTQWGNVTGGHKIGKNVIATANLYNDNSLAGSSSRGPASDGRVKPDIAAHGQGHYSTSPDNAYSPGGGTSAAAPGIAGVLTQLHQAYRELNNGANAPSALLKASLLNTAFDLGNTGPDFKFGWGEVNAYKAFKTLEEQRYVSAMIGTGNLHTHTLAIPAGVKELRVMVYWHDVEASTSAAIALVNNLDMTVNDGNGNIHYPLILDHTPDPVALDNPALPGIDSINNVEQVRITNPAQGNLYVKINGTAIPQGPQEYYLVYEYIYDEIMVTYPIGGEGLIPGASERIHWEAHGTTGNFTAEYTLDGNIWYTLSNTIPGDARFYGFTVPDTVSLAKVRISRNGVNDESDEFFSIMNTPANINIGAICSGTNTIELSWDSVPHATSYNIYLLGNMYMDSIGSSTTLNHSIVTPTIFQDNWVSVRAHAPNGATSRRAIAVLVSGSDCYLDCISDEDAGIEALISPAAVTDACSGSTLDVTVELTNISSNPQTNFPVYYQFNGNAIVVDTFTTVLPAGGNATFTFNQQIIISNQGAHNIKTWTGLLNDGAHCNDTLETSIQYFNLIAAFPFEEDFQSTTFPPATMFIDNPDGERTWEEASVVGSDGSQTKTAFVENLVYNNQGGEDYLTTVAFDLTNTNFAALLFDVSYVPYSSFYQDGLRVEISTDCGLTYSPVYFKEGDSLATAATQTTAWEPGAASDWRRDSINISAFTGNNITVRFVNINGWGNNLYIDNISLINTNQSSYCIPSSNCSVGDEIDDFAFNTISQTATGCGTDGYSNFLTYSTTLERGATYSMSLSTNYPNQFVSVWIDFNNDTIFDNLTERVLFDFNMVNQGVLYSTDVVIPTNANLGIHRMRVRAHWNGSCNDPCVHYSYGEAHDYTVVIIDPLPLLPIVDLGPDAGVCEMNSITIHSTISGGQMPYTYLWSTGETTDFITVSPLNTTSYQLTITDVNQNTAVDNIIISVNPPPVVDLGPDQTIFEGDIATLNTGLGFTSVNWSTGDTIPSILVSVGGMYTVTVTDNNGCSASDDVLVNVLPVVGPGWSYNITSSNHTILIPGDVPISIGLDSIEIGDYLGVFYDSLGTLVCAGYTVWNGSTNSISAWGKDVGYDGFESNEIFKWKIWQIATSVETEATATYSNSFPNQEQFAANGISGLESLNAITSFTQSINLVQGWSIFSSFVDPDFPDFNDVFASITAQVVIAKDGAGNVFWPLYNLNVIGDISIGEGYQINMLSTQILDVTGTAATPELTPIIIPQGWSILGYLRQTPANVEICMSSIVANIVIMKSGNGLIYWPQWGINAIGNLLPGKGYQINTTAVSVLIYPANNAALNISNKEAAQSQIYKCELNTGNNMTIGIPVDVWENIPTLGSEIGVFASNNQLVGSGIFNGNNTAITVWGEDELNTSQGLKNTDHVELRITSPNMEEAHLAMEWDGQAAFESNKILLAKRATIIAASAFQTSIFPNPANEQFTIQFSLAADSPVSIKIFNVSGIQVADLSKRSFEAGTHELAFESNHLAAGSYFYQLQTSTELVSKSFEIVR